MNKLKCAVVGLGTFGTFHARVWNELPRTELAAVCDKNEERAKAIGGKYGVPYFTDYNELLEKCDFDALSVATPDHLHREIAVEAARNGKHLLIEKPLATTSTDVNAILEAVRSAGVRAMCDLHNRVNPPFALAQQQIAADRYGRCRSLYIRMNDMLSVATDMLSWMRNSSVLWFLGAHTLDLLCFLSGSKPKTVYALSTRGVLDGMGVPTADLYQISIEMENGVIAQMENGWLVPNGSPSKIDMKCSILCEHGMIKINGSDSDMLRLYTQERMETPSCIARPEIGGRVIGFAVDNLRSFSNGILDGQPFSSTLNEAANVCFATEAILESARSGRVVNVRYE